MSDCIFCKMIAGEIKPDIVYEDEHVMAFRDIRPQAKVHVLVIPRDHISTLDDLSADDAVLPGKLLGAVQEVARREGVAATGYRTVINCRGDGGQEVYHLHLHVIGGRSMRWPPG